MPLQIQDTKLTVEAAYAEQNKENINCNIQMKKSLDKVFKT